MHTCEYVLGVQPGYQIYKCALISSAPESPAAPPGLVVALTSGVWPARFSQSEHVRDNVVYVRELI